MRLTLPVVVALLLGACASNAGPGPAAVGPEAATPPATPVHSRTVGGYTYTDAPVEARLGPNRYRIPANYFYTQMGPDFQDNFSLVVLWPDLQPLPPGVDFADARDTSIRAINISPYYIDRVPIGTLLEKGIRPRNKNDKDDPLDNLHLRVRGEPLYGLTPYYADHAKVEAYFLRNGYPTDREHLHRWMKDWYLARDANGGLSAVIKCDTRELPDGVLVQEGRAFEDPNARGNTSCTHEFILAEQNVSVSVTYMRAFLPDWKRIEAHARLLLTPSQPQR